MMVDGGGEIGRVLFLRDQVEPEDVGVVLDLLVEIGRLVGGVGDLLDTDHGVAPCFQFFSRGIDLMTSTITATSCVSPKPMSTHFW